MSCGTNKSIKCPCTYPCERYGKCCECVAHHLKRGNFPACFFSKDTEAKYDRSFEALKQDREQLGKSK